MIIVKRLNSSEDWGVWHRDVHANTTKVLYLNKTDALTTSSNIFGATNPTSTNFYVGDHPVSNNNGDTYVAYIFAHNNSDGGFGPDADQDIIKCGSYTGAYPSDVTVDLGFEPQFILVKNASASSNWGLFDVMRGMPLGDCNTLVADTSGAENGVLGSGEAFEATATGFIVNSGLTAVNNSGATHIYMAIRRGPLAVPESATDVFATGVVQNNTNKTLTNALGHPSDWAFLQTSSGGNWIVQSRLTGSADLKFNSNAAEVDNKGYGFANNTNYEADGTAAIGAYGWNFRRAPSYFDVTNHFGNSQTSAITVNHNLGVVPEMMWCKKRGATGDWMVYHKDLNGGTNPHTYRLRLNSTGAEGAGSGVWNAAPTATQFSVGTDSDVNADANVGFITYLFASLAGVSKVGSYTGDGTAGKVIDCGFSSGARFVLIKKSSDTGGWFVYDTERGIVSGNDPYLFLNSSNAQNDQTDSIDPNSSGFAVNYSNTNANGQTYIFYAIA